jgi:hypothetical protein
VEGGSRAFRGSVGPWLRTTTSRAIFFTNEHVVRTAVEQSQRQIETFPGRVQMEEVMFISADTAENRDNAKMQCHSPDAYEKDRRKDFLADWAVVSLDVAPTHPIDTPILPNRDNIGRCPHSNHIIHMPCKGTAVARGAGHEQNPRSARFHVRGDNVLHVLSAGTWGNDTINLAV